MDTDSAYIAVAGKSIDDLVVDRENYFRHRSEWLPAECCEEHHEAYVTELGLVLALGLGLI